MKFSYAFLIVVMGISLSLPRGSAQKTGAAGPTVLAGQVVRVAIVGLVHDHALGILDALRRNHNVTLVGIAEPDKNLVASYSERFSLDGKLFYSDEASMIEATHPDAVLVYTSIVEHRQAIERRQGIMYP